MYLQWSEASEIANLMNLPQEKVNQWLIDVKTSSKEYIKVL